MSEYSMYFAVGAAIFALVIGIYVYLERPWGLASEAWIDKRLEYHMRQMEHLEQEKNDLVAAKKAKALRTKADPPAMSKAVSNIDAIKAAAYLLESKLITQAQFEKMRDDIMK